MSDSFSNISTFNNLPGVIDLFSGCGGLALGFQQAGFDILYGADIQQDACDTANYNLCWKLGHEANHFCTDLTTLDAAEILPYTAGRDVVVIGGPPCQAYSTAGRAKLRSLGEDRIHLNDRRGYLFEDFIRLAIDLNAIAIVMENVPESISYGEMNVPQTVSEILEDNGYCSKWTILNASEYGVPQNRERMILVAWQKERAHSFFFPVPTHRATDTSAVGLRVSKAAVECKNYVPCRAELTCVQEKVTVREAISDLPTLMRDSSQKYKLMNLNTIVPYKTSAEYEYQMQMRANNPTNGVSGNGFRNNSRDFKTFERMQPGDNYVVACQIAEARLNEACAAAGVAHDPSDSRYLALRKSIVPPYEKEKFTEKWRRLDPDKPCPTVLAHMSKDTYAFIHPWEPRGLSVREAARMQSFPDDFMFFGSMGEAYKQIGNAVPPILAKHIALSLKAIF